MTMTKAYLSAGSQTLMLPVNPYSAQWGYQENAVSTDTLGGRVVQLLSVQITTLTVESVAGSRRELQKMAEGAREIMDYHIRTMRPANLVVPSRKWNFKVYLNAMPQMGWDVAATTYPYSLQFAIDEDISGVKSKQIETAALNRLFKGVGYDPAFHGGDPKGFEKIVKTVLAAQALGAGPGGGGTGTAPGRTGTTGGSAPGTSGVNPDKGHLDMDEIVRLAAWAFSNETNIKGGELVKNAVIAGAVCIPESGGYVGNNNSAAVNGTAYGLWQGEAGNGVSAQEIQTAEGNAIWMAREVELDYRLSISGNPHPSGTAEHAWWCYWGAFRNGSYKAHLSEARTSAGRVL